MGRSTQPQRHFNWRVTYTGFRYGHDTSVPRPEKVAVTGGAGFIGSHLVDRLLAQTFADVVAFDNFSRGKRSNLEQHRFERRLRLIEGDVRDSASVEAALHGASIVYHLAGQSTVMGAVTDPEYTFTTNVVGTFNVLRVAARSGVRRVIFASSREVYGEPIALPVEEGHPLLAINAYGASKVAGEASCRAFRRESGLDTIILRLANVYGARDFGRVIPLWIGRASTGEDFDVYGGKQVLDFIWIGHTVDALVRAATLETPLPPINVASGTGTSILDLARRITHLTHGQSHVRMNPARSMEVTRFVGNVERMRQMLGVIPPNDPLADLPGLIGAPVPTGV